MNVVRVLLLSDDPLAREGLHALLARQPGLSVVGHASTDAALHRILAEAPADVVVWDLGVAVRRSDLRLLDDLELPALLLIPDGDAAAAALSGGARGILLRQSEGERIAAAVMSVALGLLVMDDALADVVRGHREAEGMETDPLAEPLTPRETEALQLIARGLSNKEIAARLQISDHTAKFHVTAIMGKLGARSRTEAVVRAARLGLLIL